MSTEKITDRQLFSKRLQKLRGQMKKAEFARELGISAPVYQRYEDGRIPNHENLSVIARHCSVTVDWLLGREDANTPPRALHGAAAASALGKQDRLREAGREQHEASALDDLIVTMDACKPMLERRVNVRLGLEMLQERLTDATAWFAEKKG
jgi:transcriptional regulator with XRE-family HTH domain